MTLEVRVKARIATQKLVELTNKDDRDKSLPINDVVLTAAADDVRGDFRIFATKAFDDTDNRHVAMGIMGVIIKLKLYSLHPEAVSQESTWQTVLEKKLGRVTGRDRIKPISKSPLRIFRQPGTVNQDQDVFDLETGLRDIVPGTRDGGPLHGL